MGTSVLHSEFWRMMYLLTILLAASAFAVDLDRRMRFPEPEGICMDVGTMNALCVKDSPVADRFHAAAKDCFGGDEEASASRLGGRRNRTCLSFDKLLEKIDEDFKEDACFYTHLGWLNETGGINNATIYEDVSSLDSGLLQGISEQEIEDCVTAKMSAMSKSRRWRRCQKQYSDDEKQVLGELATGITGFKCFEHVFNKACRNFVKDTYIAPFMANAFGTGGPTIARRR